MTEPSIPLMPLNNYKRFSLSRERIDQIESAQSDMEREEAKAQKILPEIIEFCEQLHGFFFYPQPFFGELHNIKNLEALFVNQNSVLEHFLPPFIMEVLNEVVPNAEELKKRELWIHHFLMNLPKKDRELLLIEILGEARLKEVDHERITEMEVDDLPDNIFELPLKILEQNFSVKSIENIVIEALRPTREAVLLRMANALMSMQDNLFHMIQTDLQIVQRDHQFLHWQAPEETIHQCFANLQKELVRFPGGEIFERIMSSLFGQGEISAQHCFCLFSYFHYFQKQELSQKKINDIEESIRESQDQSVCDDICQLVATLKPKLSEDISMKENLERLQTLIPFETIKKSFREINTNYRTLKFHLEQWVLLRNEENRSQLQKKISAAISHLIPKVSMPVEYMHKINEGVIAIDQREDLSEEEKNEALLELMNSINAINSAIFSPDAFLSVVAKRKIASQLLDLQNMLEDLGKYYDQKVLENCFDQISGALNNLNIEFYKIKESLQIEDMQALSIGLAADSEALKIRSGSESAEKIENIKKHCSQLSDRIHSIGWTRVVSLINSLINSVPFPLNSLHDWDAEKLDTLLQEMQGSLTEFAEIIDVIHLDSLSQAYQKENKRLKTIKGQIAQLLNNDELQEFFTLLQKYRKQFEKASLEDAENDVIYWEVYACLSKEHEKIASEAIKRMYDKITRLLSPDYLHYIEEMILPNEYSLEDSKWYVQQMSRIAEYAISQKHQRVVIKLQDSAFPFLSWNKLYKIFSHLQASEKERILADFGVLSEEDIAQQIVEGDHPLLFYWDRIPTLKISSLEKVTQMWCKNLRELNPSYLLEMPYDSNPYVIISRACEQQNRLIQYYPHFKHAELLEWSNFSWKIFNERNDFLQSVEGQYQQFKKPLNKTLNSLMTRCLEVERKRNEYNEKLRIIIQESEVDEAYRKKFLCIYQKRDPSIEEITSPALVEKLQREFSAYWIDQNIPLQFLQRDPEFEQWGKASYRMLLEKISLSFPDYLNKIQTHLNGSSAPQIIAAVFSKQKKILKILHITQKNLYDHYTFDRFEEIKNRIKKTINFLSNDLTDEDKDFLNNVHIRPYNKPKEQLFNLIFSTAIQPDFLQSISLVGTTKESDPSSVSPDDPHQTNDEKPVTRKRSLSRMTKNLFPRRKNGSREKLPKRSRSIRLIRRRRPKETQIPSINFPVTPDLDSSDSTLLYGIPSILRFCYNMESLDLSRQPLKSLFSESFYLLKRMKRLRVNATKISSLSNIITFVRRYFPNLQELEVNDNPLQKIQMVELQKMRSLSSLRKLSLISNIPYPLQNGRSRIAPSAIESQEVAQQITEFMHTAFPRKSLIVNILNASGKVDYEKTAGARTSEETTPLEINYGILTVSVLN